MEWSRWLIGVSKYDEQCRLCGSPIPAGETLAVEEAVMGTECVGCFWEYARSLTKKARPRARPKPKGAVMPWQRVGESKPHGTIGQGTQISKWAKGTTLEGTLVDIRDGKYGPLFEFLDDKLGTVVYPVRTRLAWKLEKVAVGDRLRIECLGKTDGPGENQVWDFNVYKDA